MYHHHICSFDMETGAARRGFASRAEMQREREREGRDGGRALNGITRDLTANSMAQFPHL